MLICTQLTLDLHRSELLVFKKNAYYSTARYMVC